MSDRRFNRLEGISSSEGSISDLLQGPTQDEYYQIRIPSSLHERAKDLLAYMKRANISSEYKNHFQIKHLSHSTVLRHAAVLGAGNQEKSVALNLSPMTIRHLHKQPMITLAIEKGMLMMEQEILGGTSPELE